MRRILVLAHTGRDDALRAALDTCLRLRDSGLVPVMRRDEVRNLHNAPDGRSLEVQILGEDVQLSDIDLGMVLGGDGTVLRAAELVRDSAVPLLGVNLGHVGFLAESERADLRQTVDWVVNRHYVVEERMAIDVQVWLGNRRIAHTWALNEAAVEKANRERMIEVVMEVDGRPISTFGCDGIVMATPTGSTAYAFSAGGPVVWPGVEALIMVPISAHALFAKPLVVAPTSTMAIELLSRTDAEGVLWCDGRRTLDLPPGARVEVTRSTKPVRLARVNRTPFSERLVRKFELPTSGWRGPVSEVHRDAETSALPIINPPLQVVEPRNYQPRPETEQHMIEEIRISDLGVITRATLELDPGFTVVTGETGAGKTMVVTALGLLLGNRADAGAVRHGAKQAVAEATLRLPSGSPALARAEDSGAIVEENDGAAELILARILSAEGRSRAAVGGTSAPVGLLTELGAHLVAVHGQSDQLRLRSAIAQRESLDKFGGPDLAAARTAYQETFDTWKAVAVELDEITSASRERVREAESLQIALEEIDAVDPRPGEDTELKGEAQKLSNVEGLRSAAVTAHGALSGDEFSEDPNAVGLVDTAKRALEMVADDDPELRSLGARIDEIGILVADVTMELGSYLASLDGDGPGRLAEVEERRAALNQLIRKYAPTIDEVISWTETARRRHMDLQDDSGRIEALNAQLEGLGERLDGQAAALTALRTTAAARLSARVSDELAALAMPDARFVVEVGTLEEPVRHGADNIAMLLQPHAGSAPRPLGKGASGGELSRVMLAIEVVLAETDPVPTFVFDEVDSGVGGKAAVEIGKRLAMLARHVQVIVVTHLPQVAAYAQRHIRVIKNSDAQAHDGAGFTASDVLTLDEADRVRELARMLAGQEHSDTAQAHAEELLQTARQAMSGLAT